MTILCRFVDLRDPAGMLEAMKLLAAVCLVPPDGSDSIVNVYLMMVCWIVEKDWFTFLLFLVLILPIQSDTVVQYKASVYVAHHPQNYLMHFLVFCRRMTHVQLSVWSCSVETLHKFLTMLLLSPSSINCYCQNLVAEQAVHNALAPCLWTCSFGWLKVNARESEPSTALWALWVLALAF